MLNNADFVITAIQFPYESEDPWAVKVSYKHLRTGKVTMGLFGGKDDYLKVSKQCRDQLATRNYYTATHEPKPKKRAAAPAPIVGKGKKK